MTDTASAAEAASLEKPGGDGALSHRQIMTILSGLMLGMFLAALDQMIVATAIRTISDDLHGLSEQAWATTAYLITSTIATPLYGKLSDLYGRKPFYMLSISLFLIGSVACTFSQSMAELAAFRAFQGLGAGGLMSLALAIIADIVPPRERAKYQGYFMAVFGTSSVLGPLVGGFLAGQSHILGLTGWRWVFLVNAPIAIVALVVVGKVLNLPHTRRDHRIDWMGASAICVGVVPLLLVAEQGQSWGWGSVTSIVCYVIGVVGAVSFVVVERKMGDDALIPLRIFSSRVVTIMIITGVLIGMGMFGAMTMIPQYLQIVRGESPTKSGLMMLPMVVGMMIASIGSGIGTLRTGRYKIFPVCGTAIATVGALLFGFIHYDTPIWQIFCYMLLIGFGIGLCMQTLTVAIQNAVPAKDMGVATASSVFFRQMGGTAGVAIFLSVLFSTVATYIGHAFVKAAATPAFTAALHDPKVLTDPANKPVLQMLKAAKDGKPTGAGGALSDSSFIQKLDPRLAKPFEQGFTHSMTLVFFCAAAILALAFLTVLMLKEIPLRTQSGIQARATEEAAAA